MRLRRSVFSLGFVILGLSVMLGLAACGQRELCYDHSHRVPVSVEFDWSQAPDADPQTMVVWFFPVDGSQGLRFELMGDGVSSRGSFDAVLRVPEGTYTMVCHNGSTVFNVERGSTIRDYVITTYDVEVLSAMNRAQGAPRPDGTDGQAVRSEASRLYAHTLGDPLTVVNDPSASHRVVFTPTEATVVCDVTITGVENLHKHCFYGIGRVRPPAAVETAEQLIRAIAVLGLLAGGGKVTEAKRFFSHQNTLPLMKARSGT